MTSEQLIEVLEDADLELRSYSGRAMYGKECVAFTCEPDALIGIIAETIHEASQNYQPEQVGELVQAMKRARTDELGRSVVVYFPRVAWPARMFERRGRRSDERDYAKSYR